MSPGEKTRRVAPAETSATSPAELNAPDDGAARTSRRLRWCWGAALVIYCGLLAAKLVLACTLEPMGDEAFYWQEGNHLAVAYVDHPPVTALLVRAGTMLAGQTTIGVRVYFLVLGALFPFVVYRLTRPVMGRGDAWLAAAASLCVPVFAQAGVTAAPDVPMLICTGLVLICLERGLRERPGAWLLAGLVAGLGLTSHYRFSVQCLAGLTFFLVTRRGRELLRQPGPWIAAGIASLGALPALIINLRENFTPLHYYLEGRHSSGPHFGKLAEFLVEQLAAVGPLMFVALIATALRLWRHARAGNIRAQLLFCYAAVPFGFFFVASPWESSGLLTFHWPMFAYVSLLVALPATLRSFVARAPSRTRRIAATLVPATGLLLVLFFLYELFPVPVHFTNVRAKNFERARPVAEKLEPLLREAASGGGAAPIVVFESYKQAARIAFYLRTPARIFALDHPVNRAHGRGRQYELWGMSERDLPGVAGERAFVVRETSPAVASTDWARHVASFFTPLREVTAVEISERPPKPSARKIEILEGRIARR